jgi:hypothetical protein
VPAIVLRGFVLNDLGDCGERVAGTERAGSGRRPHGGIGALFRPDAIFRARLIPRIGPVAAFLAVQAERIGVAVERLPADLHIGIEASDGARDVRVEIVASLRIAPPQCKKAGGTPGADRVPPLVERCNRIGAGIVDEALPLAGSGLALVISPHAEAA